MNKSGGKKGVAEIPATPFAFIWFALKPYKKLFFYGVFFIVIADILGALQTYTFKQVTDLANTYTSGGTSLQSVFLWILAYPALLLLAAAAIRVSGFMVNYFTVYARTGALRILFEYLSLHSLSYFNDKFSGALSNRVTTVAQNVSRLITQFIYQILGTIVTLIITSTILFTVNTNLGIAFVCGFALLIPINWFMTRRQKTLSARMAETAATLRGNVIDVITNISAVQQYARRFFEITRLDKSIADHRDADVRSDNFGEWVLITNNILIGAFITMIVLWTFSLWSKGMITVGSLIMVVALTRGLMRELTWIGQSINNLMELYGETKDGLKEIVVPHDITDKSNARKLIVEEGQVVFENVTFAYEKDPRHVFEKLSFKVKGGQKVGIVGTSGAGKTTLMKLLLRQHDILDGGISIDGQDIREVTQESLRENVSIVPQEPMLFHRTIRENILYGKLDATDYEMIEVAKKAQAHDFIEQLPQKYDSLVGERGVKLSVGQRQRIAIARAFLKNAPVLILDEATSALDSESEVAVQKALHVLMEGKTVFAIAHRLSTLREMNRILVFKDGQIVEDGNHRTLLRNKDGVYSSFWSHQAGGFIKDS